MRIDTHTRREREREGELLVMKEMGYTAESNSRVGQRWEARNGVGLVLLVAGLGLKGLCMGYGLAHSFCLEERQLGLRCEFSTHLAFYGCVLFVSLTSPHKK